MKRFYFTFGTSRTYPYQGGWVEVWAEDIKQAAKIFKAIYPNPRDESTLNCCDYYSEEAFKKTLMYKANSNLGCGCLEIITFHRAAIR